MELPVIVQKVVFRNDQGWATIGYELNANSSQYKVEMEDLIEKNIKKNKYNNIPATLNMLEKDDNVEGQQLILVGDFFQHPKYGSQFKSTFFYQDIPTNENGFRGFLRIYQILST